MTNLFLSTQFKFVVKKMTNFTKKVTIETFSLITKKGKNGLGSKGGLMNE